MMPKNLFDEAEAVLLKNYAVAMQLHETLERIPQKYERLWDRVIGETQITYPELNYIENRSTSTTGAANRQGVIVLSNDRWPAGGPNWHSGIWIDNIGLWVIAGDDEGAPAVNIWITNRNEKEGKPVDAKGLIRALREDAGRLLSVEELAAIKVDYEFDMIGLDLNRRSLRHGLFLDDEGDHFVSEVRAKIDVLAKLIPCLSRLFD